MWIVWMKFGPTFGRSGTKETWDDPQQPYCFFGRATKNWCFLWESSRVHFNDLKLTTRAAIDVALIPDNWFLNAASAYRLKLKKGYIKNKDHDIWWIWRFRLFFFGGRSPQRLNKGSLRGAMSLEADFFVFARFASIRTIVQCFLGRICGS